LSLTVILTGTVIPQISNRLIISDPRTRALGYSEALESWAGLASKLDIRVIFAENSGFGLNQLSISATARERLQFLPVPGPSPAQAVRGKGAAEHSILRAALDGITLSEDEILLKCTGRLFIRNFKRILPKRKPRFPFLIADLPRGNWEWIDSRVFGGSVGIWREHLVHVGQFADDEKGFNYENDLARVATQLAKVSPRTVLNFTEKPWFRGQSGTTGDIYGAGLPASVRHTLLVPLDRLRRHLNQHV